MTKSQATVEVFWTAFRSLRPLELAVLERLLNDKAIREDLMDLALIESRQEEPSRPLADYLGQSR